MDSDCLAVTPPPVVAVVLCGGLGTRLGDLTKSAPKPMMDVAGRPFIERVLDVLVSHNVEKIVLAVSYLRETIQDYFGASYQGIPIYYSVEETPLGTGGAIRHAVTECGLDDHILLVANGDSYCEFDLKGMLRQLEDNDIVMVTKYLRDTSRYGTTDLNAYGRVVGFTEKKQGYSGYINAGIYLMRPDVILRHSEGAFSFEKQILEQAHANELGVGSQVSDSYFIDIGIFDDYILANDYFSRQDLGCL